MSFSGTILQVVRYTYAVMRSKALNKVSAAQAGKCEVEKMCVTWSVDVTCCFSGSSVLTCYGRLGLTAFRVVLARKSTVYKSLLKLLDCELSQGRYRGHKKRFRGLVRSGMIVVDQLSF